MNRSNYDVVYSALKVFRDALLPFLIERLTATYGESWWHDGVKRVVGERAVTEMETAHQRRFKKMSPLTRGYAELYEMLDINRFLPLVEGNWRAFSDVLGQLDTAKVWLREINDVRNAVSHPESGDLAEPDAVRAIDTMARMLRLVNQDAAAKMEELRQELRDAEKTRHHPLRDGGLDYEQAFLALAQRIAQREGEDSDELQRLEEDRALLTVMMGEEALVPGAVEDEARERRRALLERLDETAKRYLSRTFAELAVVALLPSGPEECHARIAELEKRALVIERELQQQERKKAIQRQTGRELPPLRRAIARNEKLLERTRRELDHIREVSAPSAFFRIRRTLSPAPAPTYVEEQTFDVVTSLTNLGRRVVAVRYADALAGGIALVDGAAEMDGIIGPGLTVELCYRCRATAAGTAGIYLQTLDYDGRTVVWDEVPDTVFTVRRGTEPRLVVARHYQYEPSALKVILSIENQGDRTALDVEYHDIVTVDGGRRTVAIEYAGSVPGHTKLPTLEIPFDVDDIDRLAFAPSTPLRYRGPSGETQEIFLDGTIEPVHTDISGALASLPLIGRDAELKELRDLVDALAGAAQNRTALPQIPIVTIEGLEGMGKSRLIAELAAYANVAGVVTAVQDVGRIGTTRALVADVFGVSAADREGDAEAHERFTDDTSEQLRAAVRTYIRNEVVPRGEELERLKANIIASLRALSRERAVLLVIENVHIPVEGVEAEILRAIVDDAVTQAGSYLMLCLTYRPREREGLPFMARPLPATRRKHFELAPLADPAIRQLIDALTVFPRLTADLHETLRKFHRGNPMYAIESLQGLFANKKHFVRVGGEWYPAAGIDTAALIRPSLREVVRERLESQLSPEHVEAGQILAAIGFEVPVTVVAAILGQRDPQWADKLKVLEEAGIVVSLPSVSAGTTVYQFQHLAKYEALLDTITKPQRAILSQTIAETLFHKRNLYRSSDEQFCLFAHHASEAPLPYQLQHSLELLAAAKLEITRSNFSQSLALYDKLLAILNKPEHTIDAADAVTIVEVHIGKSHVQQMLSNWMAAENEIRAAEELLGADSPIRKQTGEARRLETVLLKERGLIALHQQQSASVPQRFLEVARRRMEGSLAWRRRFLQDHDAYNDLVEVHLGLARAWARLHEMRKSRRACRRAEVVAELARKRRMDDGSLTSYVYHELGQWHAARGSAEDMKQAQYCYERALRAADDDRYESARILSAWADALRQAEHWEAAADKYTRAIEAQQQLADRQGLAISFSGLGMVYEDWADGYDSTKVEFFYERALEHADYLVDSRRLWRANAGLARIHLGHGNLERAWSHWSAARAILFDGDVFRGLPAELRAAVTKLVERFNAALRDAKTLDVEYDISATDLRTIYESSAPHTAERAWATITSADAKMRNGRWAEAEALYREAIEQSADVRGEAFERLGDLFVRHTPKYSLEEADADPEKHQDQAEFNYTQSVIVFLRDGELVRASQVYDKLIHRLTSDESGLLEIPHVLLRILRAIPADIVVHRRIVEEATDILKRNELWSEAADILIYALREWIRRPDMSIPKSLHDQYLDEAGELYRRGTAEQWMYGVNMLISVHFELGEWPEVIRGFETLCEINVNRQDPDELVESFGDLLTFEAQIELERVIRFAELAEEALQRLTFDRKQRVNLLATAGQLFVGIAERTREEEAKAYRQRALKLYEEALEVAPVEAVDSRSRILNDIAVLLSNEGDHLGAIDRLEQATTLHRTARSLCNYANELAFLDRDDEAETRYEEALQLGRKRHHRWRERLEREDEQPLTTEEIGRMHFDTQTVAGVAESFGLHLVMTDRDEARGRQLIAEAEKLLGELDLPSETANWLKRYDERMVGMPAFFSALRNMGLSDALIARIGQDASVPRVLARATPCPGCGHSIPGEDWLCPQCESRICPYCRAGVEVSTEECAHCQADLCSVCGALLENDPPLCPNCNAPVRWVVGGENPPPGIEI